MATWPCADHAAVRAPADRLRCHEKIGLFMSSTVDSYLERARDEARLVVESLVHVVAGSEVVAVIAGENMGIPDFEMDPMVATDAEDAYQVIYAKVRASLAEPSKLGAFTCTVFGVEWGALVEPIYTEDGRAIGALVVARHGRTWSKRERSVVRAFASLLSHIATLAMRERVLLHQQRLDELVASVAEHLMPATAATRQEVLQWTIKALGEFLGSDVALLRRNDHVRGLSIFEAEWPVRENVPDPDPLGEVPFDSDPIFAATKDLKSPYLTGIADDSNDEYKQHIEETAGATPAGGAAVPLLMGDTTWGVIGFIHFESHAWVPAEINALQAVASMLVQLQARIDAEERIIFNANHDELTGMPNRRALISELKNRLARRRDTAVMVIDLDRFKVMNDFLGHVNGDRLLVTMADRIQTSIRSGDFAARLGGDEFVFLVDRARSEMEALASAYRILEVISQPIEIVGQVMNHTASIGIALTDSSAGAVDLLGRADVAMYTAKARGRNRAVVFDRDLHLAVDERSQMELMLRDAIDSGGLRLHFQPEVDLQSGKLLAVESLVRWQHPTRGLLQASDFITVAEETGLVSTLGRWVFAEACRQLGAWSAEYPELDFAVRVNMSPADFKVGDLVQFVEGCLTRFNVPGNRLCVEITEYAVVEDPEQTARILRGFQALGIEIALDDFGTGFASMTELKNLPVDFLKLDMSFVRGIAKDPFDRAIVDAIIRLGRALGKEIIAEGVESRLIVDELLELGCHRGQGYLISKPVASPDLSRLLRAGSTPQSLLRVGSATDAAWEELLW